jgi:hypothetical protein
VIQLRAAAQPAVRDDPRGNTSEAGSDLRIMISAGILLNRESRKIMMNRSHGQAVQAAEPQSIGLEWKYHWNMRQIAQ